MFAVYHARAEFVGKAQVGTDIAVTDIEYGFVRI